MTKMAFDPMQAMLNYKKEQERKATERAEKSGRKPREKASTKEDGTSVKEVKFGGVVVEHNGKKHYQVSFDCHRKKDENHQETEVVVYDFWVYPKENNVFRLVDGKYEEVGFTILGERDLDLQRKATLASKFKIGTLSKENVLKNKDLQIALLNLSNCGVALKVDQEARTVRTKAIKLRLYETEDKGEYSLMTI